MCPCDFIAGLVMFGKIIEKHKYKSRKGTPGHYTYVYDEAKNKKSGKGQVGLFSGKVEEPKPKKRESAAQRQLSLFGEAETRPTVGAAEPKHQGRAKPKGAGQTSIFDAPEDTKTIDVEEAIAEKKTTLQVSPKPDRPLRGSSALGYLSALREKHGDGTPANYDAMAEAVEGGWVSGAAVVGSGYKNPKKAALAWIAEKKEKKAEKPASATESILSKITPEKVMEFVTPGKGALAASNTISIGDALFYLGDDGQEGYSIEQGRELKTPLRKEREALVRQKLDEMVQQGTLKKIGPETYARPDFGTKPAGENEYFGDSPYRT